jgi:hypothetical protein
LDAGELGKEDLNRLLLAQQRVPLGEAEEPQDLLGSRVLHSAHRLTHFRVITAGDHGSEAILVA